MSYSRSLHKKSRNGCENCKRRRKKCDQSTPCCHGCRRRGVRCSYESLYLDVENASQLRYPTPPALEMATAPRKCVPDDITKYDSAGSSSDSSTAPGLKSLPIPDQPQAQPVADLSDHAADGYNTTIPQPIPSPLEMQDLELLHNFQTVTAITIPNVVAKLPIWQHNIPFEAASHAFLMHALLAFSALHAARLRPNINNGPYKLLAIKHECEATRLFRQEVKVISPENCNAMFTFTTLIVMFALSILHPQFADDGLPLDAVEELLNRFCLVRSTVPFWIINMPEFFHGGMKTMFQRGALNPAAQMSPAVKAALLRLESLNHDTNDNRADREEQSVAIAELLVTWKKVLASPTDWAIMLSWPCRLSDRFINLLHQRRPLALVILAYFCLLVKSERTRWYLDGWGEWAYRSIRDSLHEERWHAAMDWMYDALSLNKEAPSDGELLCTKGWKAGPHVVPGDALYFFIEKFKEECAHLTGPAGRPRSSSPLAKEFTLPAWLLLRNGRAGMPK